MFIHDGAECQVLEKKSIVLFASNWVFLHWNQKPNAPDVKSWVFFHPFSLVAGGVPLDLFPKFMAIGVGIFFVPLTLT